MAKITLNGVDALTESGGVVTIPAATNLTFGAGAVPSAAIQDGAVDNANLNLDYSDATYRAPTIDNSFAAATKTIKKINATRYYTVNDILVFLNGVCLIPTTDYTVNSSGTATLTLVEGAPATASSLVVRYLAL